MRKEIQFLLCAENAWLLGEGMLGPLLVVFSQKVGGDLLDIAWLWSTYLILTGLLIILVGMVSDRVDKTRLLFAGFALNTAMTFAYVLVDSPGELLLLQAGLAVAAGLATPTWDSLFSQYHDPHRSGYMWGLHSGQAHIVGGVAVVLGGLIVSAISFTALFVIMGSLQVFSTLCLIPLVGASRAKRDKLGGKPLKAIRRLPGEMRSLFQEKTMSQERLRRDVSIIP